MLSSVGVNKRFQRTHRIKPELLLATYPNYSELVKATNIDNLKQKIKSLINMLGFTDFDFNFYSPVDSPMGILSTFPNSWFEQYYSHSFFEYDARIDYILANALPTYWTTINAYIERAPYITESISKNRALVQLSQNFGFAEYYIIPVNSFGQTAAFIVSCQNESAESIQQKVANCKDELIALAKAVKHVCLNKFKADFQLPCRRNKGGVISARAGQVLASLANGSPNINAVAEELCISRDTVNKHLASAKKALGAVSTIQAVALALNAGIISISQSPIRSFE